MKALFFVFALAIASSFAIETHDVKNCGIIADGTIQLESAGGSGSGSTGNSTRK